MIYKRKHKFDSSFFVQSQGGCALSGGGLIEQGFLQFSTDTEVSVIM